MRESRFLIIPISALFALLILLATLQYLWVGRIADAERERLQNRLQTDSRRLAEDFNREIRAAYFTFQIDPEDWLKKDWKNFNIRYRLWETQTRYPQLIQDFYFVGKDSPPFRFDAAARDFKLTEWTDELREIERKMRSRKNRFSIEAETINTFTLLMPNFAAGRQIGKNANGVPVIEADLSGFLVIKLDETIIRRLLADLGEKHFSGDETMRFQLLVTADSGSKVIYPENQNETFSTENADARISIFDLSSSDFKLTVNSSVFSRKGETNALQTAPDSPPRPAMDKDDTVKVQMTGNRDAPPETADVKGWWMLSVSRAGGTLEEFVASARRKNLAIGFAVLTLLAASVVLIFVSAHRARVLARRQMEFVSAVSHEFRTPLAVIRSAGENLTDGIVDSENRIAEYGGLIKRESDKLSAMVEQILEFAGGGRRSAKIRSASGRRARIN